MKPDHSNQLLRHAPPAELSDEQKFLKRHGIVLQTAQCRIEGLIHIGSVEGKTEFVTGTSREQVLERICKMHGIEMFTENHS